MAITKIQSGAIPAEAIDTTHIGDVGADKITGQVVSSQISDLNVTHAKLHTTMDLSSKTVTLPSLSQTIVNSSHIQMGGNLDVVGQIGAYDNPGSSWGKMILRATDFELKNAGGTINMVLDTSGNVGIGTSSPQGLIDLTVSQAKTATSGATFARLGKTNEGSNYASLNCEIKGGASAADRKWSFQTVEQGVANAGSILFQPDGGNVGIGTSSIAANTKLIVKAATDQNLEVEYTSGKLRLSALNDARSANVPLQFTSTSFEFLSGNVGIGTNSPATKLHIVDGNNVAQFGDLNSNSTMSLRMSDTAGSPVEIQAYSDTLRLRTHPSGGSMQDRLTILSGGNVGIGTTSPAGRLHVLGTGGTSSTIQIESTGSGNTVLYMKGQAGSDFWGMFTGSTGGGLTLKDETNVKDAFIARPSGYMAYPNCPRFSAGSNNSTTTYAANTPFVFDSTSYNVNSCYNTTTGIFTAPVNGHYRFSASAYTYVSGQVSALHWNGSVINNYNVYGGDHTFLCTALTNEIFNMTWTAYLQSGHGMAIGWRNGYSGNIYRAHGHFDGELISAT